MDHEGGATEPAGDDMAESIDDALAAAARAVALVSALLPHLAGLAHSVRIAVDHRINTAGVFSSGRLLINSGWWMSMTERARAFVLAHELLHLAFGTHDRCGNSDRGQFNVAHDLIINDVLETELAMEPPNGGVRRPGARASSAEALLVAGGLPTCGGFEEPQTMMAAAMRRVLGRPGQSSAPTPSDVLDGDLESAWFPGESVVNRCQEVAQIQRVAARVSPTKLVISRAGEIVDALAGPSKPTDQRAYVDALETAYRPPWELALHRWLDGVGLVRRTYSRAPRRGADRTDVVLPGRIREEFTLSIVLDTSGSMTADIAAILGAISNFAHAAHVSEVRVVQCDTSVTVDEIVEIESLATYEVVGYGGSDMSPAMEHLARDPETTAVVVITDGFIDYPSEPPPYEVLWTVCSDYHEEATFSPSYGTVIPMDPVRF